MSIGLTSAILTPKFIVGDESRIQTNRIQNPEAMMCPVWGGSDLSGRQVCGDSFYTKQEGCSSSLDRIKVENFLRPAYTNFVTISATGITGQDANYGTNLATSESGFSEAERKRVSASNGRFGLVSGAESIIPSNQRMELARANAFQSADKDAVRAQNSRAAQNATVGYKSQTTYDSMNSGKTNPNTVYQYNQFGNYEVRGPRLSGYATLNGY